MTLVKNKEEELKQGEGLLKKMEQKNSKLHESLDQSRSQVHKRNIELGEKEKEIKNVTSMLIMS